MIGASRTPINLNNSLNSKGPFKKGDAVKMWRLYLVFAFFCGAGIFIYALKFRSFLMLIIGFVVIFFLIFTYKNFKKGYGVKK